MSREERIERILHVLAHSCVSWTMGNYPEREGFQDLKDVYLKLPSNRYKAEKLADWMETL